MKKSMIACAVAVTFLMLTAVASADIAVAIPDFNVTLTGAPHSYGITLTEGQTIYGLNLVADWDSDGTYAYPNEMEVYVNPPSGNAFDWDPITSQSGTADYHFDETLGNVWPTGENSVGYWSFCFDTSYGSANMANVTMNLLSTEPTPPTPPVATPIALAYDGDAYMNDGDVHWYSFTLGATTGVEMDTSDTAINFPATGMDDTEMGLYDIWGSRIAYDDDSGEGFLSFIEEMSLDAGIYYLAVAGYNSDFGLTDFGVTGGGVTGDYTLTVTPEPATLSLLAFGALALIRRRR